jgi:hypothetical protein
MVPAALTHWPRGASRGRGRREARPVQVRRRRSPARAPARPFGLVALVVTRVRVTGGAAVRPPRRLAAGEAAARRLGVGCVGRPVAAVGGARERRSRGAFAGWARCGRDRRLRAGARSPARAHRAGRDPLRPRAACPRLSPGRDALRRARAAADDRPRRDPGGAARPSTGNRVRLLPGPASRACVRSRSVALRLGRA